MARAEDAIRTDEEMSKVMANIEDYYRGVRDDIEKLEFKAERKYLQGKNLKTKDLDFTFQAILIIRFLFPLFF